MTAKRKSTWQPATGNRQQEPPTCHPSNLHPSYLPPEMAAHHPSFVEDLIASLDRYAEEERKKKAKKRH